MKKKLFLILLALMLLCTACSAQNRAESEAVSEGTDTTDLAYDGTWEAHPSEVPAMCLSMTNGEVAGCVALKTYGYSWSWEENGETQTVIADAIHPLEDEDLLSIHLSDTDGTVYMESDARMTEVRVSVWRKGADYDDVNLLFPSDGVIELNDEPCVYVIEAEYGENGSVTYAFLAE